MNISHLQMQRLYDLNFSEEEAKVYLELLKKPNTHLQIARNTGVNRTKVYRIMEQFEKRSLATRRTDDRGVFLVANDPKSLEIELITQEEKLRQRRKSFDELAPVLAMLGQADNDQFMVNTYSGIEGFKQMQWHELKSNTEILVFGNVTVEQLVGSHRWSEKFRALTAERGCKTREIFNNPYEKPNFTQNQDFMSLYSARMVPEQELPMATPMVIYNDTVAIYQFDHHKRVGAEIVNKTYANTIRSIFEHYWRLGEKI